MDILRFCVSGNVDDGKSTMIGRLLFDMGCLTSDQRQYLEAHRAKHDLEMMDFSIITDGLFDERSLKITIDVAYRYFNSTKRKFIAVDTPGHAEFIRNMVSGASVCDVSLVIVDATVGVSVQTKRHCLIARQMGIKKFIFCINKMDLVHYRESTFLQIEKELGFIAEKLNIEDFFAIPICALHGDNLVEASRNMQWYRGDILADVLDNINPVQNKFPEIRIPVQFSSSDFTYGSLEGGDLHLGDEVVILPGFEQTTVKGLTSSGNAAVTATGHSQLVLELDGGHELKRGSMVVGKNQIPKVSRLLQVRIIWLGNSDGTVDQDFTLIHTTHQVKAGISKVKSIWDINNFLKIAYSDKILRTNEIYDVILQTENEIFFDPYVINKATGSFILCDPSTNQTVAAGMLLAN